MRPSILLLAEPRGGSCHRLVSATTETEQRRISSILQLLERCFGKRVPVLVRVHHPSKLLEVAARILCVTHHFKAREKHLEGCLVKFECQEDFLWGKFLIQTLSLSQFA